MFFNLEKKNKIEGMTFIELVVVMGIFTTMSAVALFNYRDFSSGVKLQNLSQEIALQAKRAQTLAVQGRRPILSDAQINNGLNGEGFGPQTFVPTDWVSSYGLAFRTSTPADQKRFIFYFNSSYSYSDDYSGDEGVSFDTLNAQRNLALYDFLEASYVGCGTTLSECVEEIRITDGSYIELICIEGEPQIDPDCTNEGAQSSELYVTFTRPLLESYILSAESAALPSNEQVSESYAFIKLSSASGDQKRYVVFWKTGQVSVF